MSRAETLSDESQDRIRESEEDFENGDYAELPARTEEFESLPTADRISEAADAMEEFNRLLWQVAKGVGIIAAILFFLFMVFAMYVLAQAGWGFLG